MCCIPHGLGLTKKVEKLIFTPPPSTSICRRGGCKKFFLFSQPQTTYETSVKNK